MLKGGINLSKQAIYFDDQNSCATKQSEEIQINNEPPNILETLKEESLEGCFTLRSLPKRKSTSETHESIKSYFGNEKQELNILGTIPYDQLYDEQSPEKDIPDLIDISELCDIKQEKDTDNLSLLESEDCSGTNNSLASKFLDTDITKEDSGSNYVPHNKMILKTDQILGIKTLKNPGKGPYQIVGSIDTVDGIFKIKCDLCSKQFNTKIRFNSHLQLTHNIDKEQCVLQCKYCPQRSKITYYLKIHMLVYHLDKLNFKTKRYKCSKCHLQSADSEEVQKHKEETVECQGAAILLFHTCMECPFKTDIISKFETHLRLHYKSGGLKCPHCTFKCSPSKKQLLSEHLLLHKI